MNDTVVSETGTGANPEIKGSGRAAGFVRVLRRTPFTAAFVLAMLVVGVATGSLWAAAADQPWYHEVATGLPAFAEGRWWSVFTALFFVDHPWVYLTLMPLVIGGLGWAE